MIRWECYWELWDTGMDLYWWTGAGRDLKDELLGNTLTDLNICSDIFYRTLRTKITQYNVSIFYFKVRIF